MNLCSGGIQCRTSDDEGLAEISASGFHTQSSLRYKSNIKDLSSDESKIILKLRPVSFIYTGNDDVCYGLIAEEVDPLYKYAVAYDKQNRPDAIDYSKFIAPIIKIIQEHEERLNSL